MPKKRSPRAAAQPSKKGADPRPKPTPSLPVTTNLRPVMWAVVGIAALIRLAATWNDLWLDEIWTFTLIANLHSPLGILTVHHDNNHVLNTLFLYLLRPIGWDWLYRLPALVAGIAIVVLGARVAWLDDPASPAADDASPELRALAAALVLGVSHPLIQYASEARGYSLALAFGLGAIAIAVKDGLQPRSRRAPICWVLVILAFLSHALALHVLTALIGWGIVRTLRRDRFSTSLATLAWWFAVPAAAFGAFYWGFLRGITVGGGNREGIGPPLARALAMVSGFPRDVPEAVTLVAVLAVAAAALWILARRGSDLWVFFAVGIVVSPAALAVIQQTNLYAERYFLVSMVLWLLLFARLLAWLATRAGAARAAALVGLALFALANGARVADLLRDGRGHYQDAIRFMVAHTTGDVTAIASDHDFRNRLVVEYFGPRMSKPVRYVSRADTTPTQWYLVHKNRGDTPPALHMTTPRGGYRLVRSYPTASLSGFSWFVFERETPPSG